jgi:hypothetical protein
MRASFKIMNLQAHFAGVKLTGCGAGTTNQAWDRYTDQMIEISHTTTVLHNIEKLVHPSCVALVHSSS